MEIRIVDGLAILGLLAVAEKPLITGTFERF